MKLLLVVLIFVAGAAAVAPGGVTIQEKLGAVDWPNVWRGIVYGVQRNPSVPSTCITGAPPVGSDWTALKTSLGSFAVWQAMYDLRKYVDDLNQVARLCNLQGLASNMQEYMSFQVLAAKITINLSFYSETFGDLSTSWQAGTFYQVGVDIGKILARTFDYYI